MRFPSIWCSRFFLLFPILCGPKAPENHPRSHFYRFLNYFGCILGGFSKNFDDFLRIFKDVGWIFRIWSLNLEKKRNFWIFHQLSSHRKNIYTWLISKFFGFLKRYDSNSSIYGIYVSSKKIGVPLSTHPLSGFSENFIDLRARICKPASVCAISAKKFALCDLGGL